MSPARSAAALWGEPACDRVQRLSYSGWRDMQRCLLRYGFAADPLFRGWRRGSTRSAVGLVRHNMLKRLGETAAPPLGGPDQWFSEAWQTEVDNQWERLREEWAPAVPPDPESWQDYAVVRARLRRSVTRAFKGPPAEPNAAPQPTGSGVPSGHNMEHQNPPIPETGGSLVERWFTDQTRGLFGQLDRVENVDGSVLVIDYKNGVGQTDSHLVEAHRSQLLFYAGLIHAAWETWPRLVIRPASERDVRIDYSPQDVEALRSMVAADSAKYNDACATGTPTSDLADPAPANCAYCPFRVLCRPFQDDWNQEQYGTIGTQRGKRALSLVTGRVVDVGQNDDGTFVHVEQPAALTLLEGEVSVTGLPSEADVRIGQTFVAAGIVRVGDRTARAPWDTPWRVVE